MGINKLDMLVAGYWWGDTSNKRKIHWKKWEDVYCSKLNGGLGFKNLESFNLAMAKHCWRLIHNEQSLSFKVLQSRYFPNNDPMQAKKGSKGSYSLINIDTCTHMYLMKTINIVRIILIRIFRYMYSPGIKYWDTFFLLFQVIKDSDKINIDTCCYMHLVKTKR